MQIEKITRQGYAATLSKEALWDIYKSMKTQRLLEDRLLKMYKGCLLYTSPSPRD